MLPSLFMGLLLAALLIGFLYLIRIGKKQAVSQEESAKQAKISANKSEHEASLAHNTNSKVLDLVNEYIGNAFSTFKLSSYTPYEFFENDVKKIMSFVQEYEGEALSEVEHKIQQSYVTKIIRLVKNNQTLILKMDCWLLRDKKYILKDSNKNVINFTEGLAIRDVVVYYPIEDGGRQLSEEVSKLLVKYRFEYVNPPKRNKVEIKSLYLDSYGGISSNTRRDSGFHKTEQDIHYLYGDVEVRVGNQQLVGPLSKIFGVVLEGVSNGYSLVLGGPQGAGKTQLAGFICKVLSEEISDLSVFDIEPSMFSNPTFRAQWRNTVFSRVRNEETPDKKIEAIIMIDQAEKIITTDPSVVAEITSSFDTDHKLAVIMCYNGTIGTKEGVNAQDALIRPGRAMHIRILPLSSTKAVAAAEYIAGINNGTVDKALLNKIISTETPASGAGFATLAEVGSAVVIENSTHGIDAKLGAALNADTKREG